MTEKEQILIDKFLSNTLNEVDKSQLNKALESEDFRNALLATGIAIDEVKRTSDKEFLEQVKSNVGNPYSTLLKILIVLLFLAGLIYLSLVIFSKPKKELQKLYVQYPPMDMARGNSNIDHSVYKEALGYYINEDYKKASIAFKSMERKNDTTLLYIANCDFLLGNKYDASQHFFMLTESQHPGIRENADYYLLFSLIDMGRKKDANNLYQEIISNPNHKFISQVKKLEKFL